MEKEATKHCAEMGVGLIPVSQILLQGLWQINVKTLALSPTLGRCSISSSYCYFLLLSFSCKGSYHRLQLILVLLPQLFVPNAFLSSESSSLLFLRRIASFSAVSKVLAAGHLFPPEMAFLAIQGFLLAFKFCASCLASCMPSPHGGGWGWCKCYISCLTSWQLSHEVWSLGKKYPLFDSSYILLLSCLP